MDNWLAKLASEQPTNEENLEQALGELSLPELQQIAAHEQPATPNLDSLEEKIAEADQLGRDLAKSHGPGLAAQAEHRATQNHQMMASVADLSDDDAIKLAYILEYGSDLEKEAGFAGLAGKALKMGKGLLSKASPALGKATTGARGLASKGLSSGAGQKALAWGAKNPMAAGAAVGGTVGGVHSKATGGSFLGGAALGAGMGAGGVAMAGKGAAGRFLGKTHSRFNKMAGTKQAAGILTTGKMMRNAATNLGVLGGAGGAVKGLVSKPGEGESRLGNMARSGAKGALGGAAIGAGTGALGSHLVRKGTGNLARGMRAGMRQAGTSMKGMPKVASPLSGAIQAMVAHDLSKLAYMDDNKNEWLEQFEGSPLLEQAVNMVQEELQTEIDGIEHRKQEDEHRREMDTGPASYHEKDMLRAKKKMLELQLVAQRNGMGDPTGAGADMGGEQAPPEGGEMMPPEGGEMPPAEAAPQPEAAPMEAAQEQVKMAYAMALSKTAMDPILAGNLASTGIGLGIQAGGYAIGKNRGRQHHAEGTGRESKHPVLKSLFVPGGLGHEIGRRKGYDQAEKEKGAGYNLARVAKSARLASSKAAKAAKGAKPRMVGGLSTTPLTKMSGLKEKLLIGAGVAGAGALGAGVGHKKGKKKGLNTGRRQGYGVGVQRGYNAGAQRGYQVGRSHSAAAAKKKTASFS